MDWRDAILRWHKEGLAPVEARRLLQGTLNRRFRNQREIAATMERFDTYVDRYADAKLRSIRVRMTVEVPLPQELAAQYRLSGEVPRLDRRSDFRYVACLFVSQPGQEVSRELRLPLIQSAIAEALNLELDEMLVAIYHYRDGLYQEFCFSESQVNAAYSELNVVLGGVHQALKDLSASAGE